MTRYTAYAVHPDGTRYRHPFATFPHAEAAYRWLDAHADRVAFVPPLPDEAAEPETLGACGCTDYHMADCPTRTGYADALARDEYDEYDR